MFTIYVYTFDNNKIEKSVLDKDLAINYFRAFSGCEDVKSVVMTDGLTGEVLYDYSKRSGWNIFNGQTIGF